MSLTEQLAEALGPDALVPQEQVDGYAVDGLVPEAVVSPGTVEELGCTIGLASREGLSVTPWGGGTQMALGNPPSRVDMVVRTAGLDRVVEHSVPDFTLSVGAGATLASVQDYLAKEGQQLFLDAPLPRKATLGGILAANTATPRRLLYRASRDWVLGLKVVQADGAITAFGGQTMKNVSGFDLTKLYIGSLGTLGIIVGATFRLLPVPRVEEMLVASYGSLQAAFKAARSVASQSFTPQCVEVLTGAALRAIPEDARRTGAQAALLVSLAGWPGAVTRMMDESARLLSDALIVERASGGESAALWRSVTDLGWGDGVAPYISMKASLPLSRLGETVVALESLPLDGLSRGMVIGAGYGGVRCLLWGEAEVPGRAEKARKYAASARGEVSRLGGYLVVERCSPEVKQGLDVWGGVPGGVEVMRRIKKELDPKGVFNPGRFVEGI